MLRFNLNFILRWKHKIPKYHRNIWWNRSCYMGDTYKYPKVFDHNNRYIDCQIGKEVKMGETTYGEDIIYRVVNVWTTPGSDWLSKTDAFSCDMKFTRIEKSNIDNKKQCDFPLCSGKDMKQGEVYRCKKSPGAIMGICLPNSSIPSIAQIEKIIDKQFDN